MCEIKAIVRPERVDGILHALHTRPELPGVTVSKVTGDRRRTLRRGVVSPTQGVGTNRSREIMPFRRIDWIWVFVLLLVLLVLWSWRQEIIGSHMSTVH